MKPYYQEPGIVIYHGDCREILPHLPGADLVVTSPPYNLGNTEGYLGGGGDWHRSGNRPDRRWSGKVLWNGYGQRSDNMPWPQYEAWQREILLLCWERLTAAGAIYYNHRPRVRGTQLWTPLAVNPGLPVRQIVIWARAGGMNCSPTYYQPTHEWIVIFAKPAFRLRNVGASGVGDVWYIPQEANTCHPAPFPLQLALRAIETTRAQTVLDPFMGSGTTLVAAKRLGCSAIGVEIVERYCEQAVERLRQDVFPFAGSNPA